MKKVAMVVGLQFLLGVAIAQDVATVNPERHSGGFAKLPNNKIFQPSQNPIPLDPKTLSQSDRDIANIANQIIDSNATTSILLIDNGKIVFEKYKSPATPESPLFSQSMSKSLTAYTIGVLLCEGKIKSLDDKAETYAPELKGTVFGDSSIKDLLTMSSGAKDGVTSGQTYIGEWQDIAFKGVTTSSIMKKYGQR